MALVDPPDAGEGEFQELAEGLERAYREALSRFAGGEVMPAVVVPTGSMGPRRVPPPAAPTMPRFYETTCIDLPGSGAAMQVISFPQRPDRVAAWQIENRDTRHTFTNATSIAAELGLEQIRGMEPDLLVPALLYTRPDHAPTYDGELRGYEDQYEPDEYVKRDVPRFAGFVAGNDPRLTLFATRMAYEPLVPVEQSPLRATSAATLLGTTGSSATLGWVAGIHDPWLLIVAPLTVVLMGAATGLAAGLHEGLRRNVVRWLTGTDPGPTGESGEVDPPALEGG